MGSDLVTLDSGEIMDPEIIRSLNEASSKGKEMYDEFVKDRIEQATKPLSDVIPRMKMYTFSNQPPADLRKGVNKVTSYKANTALVTKLFISLKARPDADIDDFFRLENQREPPSLCDQGKMITGTKSALLGCLPGMPEPGRSAAAREATVVVLDMAAVIHMIKPQRAKVFGDYTKTHLIPFLEKQITNNTTRVDAVWDKYLEDSLKPHTREKRSAAAGRRLNRISELIPLPKGAEWQKFLKETPNKDQLFRFLSSEFEKNSEGVSSSNHES